MTAIKDFFNDEDNPYRVGDKVEYKKTKRVGTITAIFGQTITIDFGDGYKEAVNVSMIKLVK